MSKKNKNIIERFASKGVFPYQMAFTLLIPLRNIFLSPKQLIKRMELSEEHHVLEVGSGPGYFSIKVAKYLERGQLVLADIQQEMLNFAKKRIDRKDLKNVNYCLCDGRKFNYPNNSFDRIFMVTVIGEVENKEAYLQEFYRILKPGGLLSISELAGDPDKMTPDELKLLVSQTDFNYYNIHGSKRNYTVNFQK